MTEWDDRITNIQERFPLDRIKTLEICEKKGIQHPADPHMKAPLVMTSDFFLTVYDSKTRNESFICRSILPPNQLNQKRIIERILSLYPQVIVHSNYKNQSFNIYQISWLKLDCPFDGSLKGLCISFLKSGGSG